MHRCHLADKGTMMFQRMRQTTAIWWWAAWLTLLVTALVWAARSPSMVPLQPIWLFGLITWIAGLCVAALIGLLAVGAKKILFHIPNFYIWAFVASLPIFFYAYDPIRSDEARKFIFVLFIGQATLLGLCIEALLRTTWSSRRYWTKIVMGSLLTLSLTGIGLSILWMSTSIFNQQIPFHWHIPKDFQPIALTDPSKQGPYKIKSLYYGSGKDLQRPEYGAKVDLKTPSVDGSAFISGWEGFWGELRTHYWGFTPDKLPLNARVWYPEGKGPFPLILLVHGNHDMEEYSDPGYEYLGTLFASRGFIAFSVDENFLNGSWTSYWDSVSTNPARSWLLLEHLNLWRQWAVEKGNPFFGKVDMNKIVLMGHSRGGEAVATAAALNQLPYYPDDATVPFNYHFNILGVAAIAPVDKQYTPANRPIRLDNLDYFVLQGAHDGDVRTFYGLAEFNRVSFKGKDYHFKAAAYVARANHGRFNSSWDWLDVEAPADAWMKSVDLLPREVQQKLAQVYLSAFLEVVCNKELGYLPLFQDYRKGYPWLPESQYISLFEDSKDQYVVTLEEGLDVTKDSKSGAQMSGQHLTVWRQQEVDLKRGKQDISAVYLGWTKTKNKNAEPASYTVDLPSQTKVDANDQLIFLAADSHEQAGSSPPCNCRLDFTIQLEDVSGNTASLPLSHIAPLSAPIIASLMKIPFMETDTFPEVVFQRYAIPLKDFVAKNPQFQPTQLSRIRFVFDRSDSGVVALTHIGFRTE